ncbi:nitrite reductase/ring-hydroxylating ferredoxin subunit [Bradyrhizobium sp. USDA 4510]
MMSQEANDLITRTGRKDPCGKLMRSYWQPAALVDELDGPRPVRPVRLLGENLVLFRGEDGSYGLIDRHCAHRGADLAFGRLEHGGLRCAFHGWLFDTSGQCIETPAEPAGSQLCKGIRQRSYPVVEKSGILWAWLGEGAPPAFPELDCFVAPGSHTFAFKGHMNCNWLQALEVGIDPAHASFLHRFFEDEDTSAAYGKQFRGASAGSDMPMTKILREYDRPIINVEHTEYGLRLIALRELDAERTHVRVTNQLFPHGFVIPMSTEMTITQWHVPVDDENCYWYAIFTSYAAPVDKQKMRDQRLELYTLPDYKSRKNKSNDYGFDPHEQATETYTGMGTDINVHDQWAVESMGAIQDRTNEHLGQSDKAIVQYRPPAAAGDREGLRRREADAVPRRRLRAQYPGPGHDGRHRPDPGLGALLDGSRRQAPPRRTMGSSRAARDRRQGASSDGGGVKMVSMAPHCILHLAPLAGRGRIALAIRVRGYRSIGISSRRREPLTPTLSPRRAGRGRSEGVTR